MILHKILKWQQQPSLLQQHVSQSSLTPEQSFSLRIKIQENVAIESYTGPAEPLRLVRLKPDHFSVFLRSHIYLVKVVNIKKIKN